MGGRVSDGSGGFGRLWRAASVPWVAVLLFVPPVGAAAAEAEAEAAAAAAPRLLSPSATYEGTVLSNVAGGRRTGTAYVGNLHLRLGAEGESLGLSGSSAFIDVLTIHGGRPTRLVGDAQDTSNIEGPIGTEFEEIWLQQNFEAARVSVLAGLYDLNSEFYTLQAAGLFLNGSFGIGPDFADSGAGGPSVFPRTSAALRVAWQPSAESAIRVALVDGVPLVRGGGTRAVLRRGDGVLGVVEFAATSSSAAAAGTAPDAAAPLGRPPSTSAAGDKLAVGVWHYTGRFDDLSDLDTAGRPLRRSGSAGLYVVGERALFGSRAMNRHVSGFFQAGVADPRTNRFATYLGLGGVAGGWDRMAEGDEAGFAIARAVDSAHYRRAAARGHDVARAETTAEVSYLRRINRWLTVQPDLQYVVRPNTDRAIPNAWVVQCRFLIEFDGF